ncbi:MAG: hypothetical protein RSE54_00620 [Ruthenibacterium sp.]
MHNKILQRVSALRRYETKQQCSALLLDALIEKQPHMLLTAT